MRNVASWPVAGIQHLLADVRLQQLSGLWSKAYRCLQLTSIGRNISVP